MIWTRITARAPNEKCLRRRSRGRVECCRPVVSGHSNKYGWPLSLRGLCPRPPHSWTVLAKNMTLQQFLPPRHLKVCILASFLLLLLYFVQSSLWVKFGIPFYVLLCYCFVVTGLDSGPGVESSGGSDVFVCEAALDTPSQESDVVSTLPAEPSHKIEPNMDELPLE